MFTLLTSRAPRAPRRRACARHGGALPALLLSSCALIAFAGCSAEDASGSDNTAGQSSGGSSTGGSAGAQTSANAGSAGTGGSSAGGDAGGGGASGAAQGGSGGDEPAGGASGSGSAGGSGGSGPVLTGTVSIMVMGSSNELQTCWRAFLQKKLQDASIANFDFVGGVSEGPDCNMPSYDKDLQAQSGQIVTNLGAQTFADWFTANPPSVILMHFGGADILQNMPIDGVMEGYSRLLTEARNVTPNVILMAAQHTPQDTGGCNDCDANVQALNAAIATWATQNTTAESQVVVVDLYTGLDLDADFSDRVHLNDAGSHKVADRFFALLEPLFGP